MQKSWYAVKSVDQEEFMILTAVSKQHVYALSSSHNLELCQDNNLNIAFTHIVPSVWKLPSTAAQISERTQ